MNKKLENWIWIYAFVLVGLAYILGIFIDLTGDSGLYAAISRQMVESGNWLTLKINGQPYDQKPHLFFWLAGLGIRLFGNSNFAFKLFPFLYGLGGIYFTFRLGKQLFSAEAGKLAALVAATSQLYFLYFFDFHTDTVLQTGVVFSLWQLAAYLQNKKSVHFIFGFLGVGFAMLSKGPIGAALPFFAVLFYLLFRKDFRQLLHAKWVLGILISVVIISPALFHLYRNFGFEGIRFYFITNNFGRITGDYAGSNTDYFFYLHTFLWAFLPWTIFVFAALILEIKSWVRKKPGYEWGIFLLGSVLALLLVLSIARGKAPNYILIVISPVSVIAGNWMSRFFDVSVKTRTLFIRLQEILAGIIILFFTFIAFVFSIGNLWMTLILVLLLVVSVVFVIVTQQNKLARIILVLVMVTGTLNLYFNAILFPELFKYQGARQALAIYEQNRGENDLMVTLQLEEYELFFWAEAPVENFTTWENFYAFLKKDGAWVYTNQNGYEVVKELTPEIKEVYEIPQRGMNEITLRFLNPSTRDSALKKNYLIKVK